jgi:hypothetical protein
MLQNILTQSETITSIYLLSNFKTNELKTSRYKNDWFIFIFLRELLHTSEHFLDFRNSKTRWAVNALKCALSALIKQICRCDPLQIHFVWVIQIKVFLSYLLIKWITVLTFSWLHCWPHILSVSVYSKQIKDIHQYLIIKIISSFYIVQQELE